METEIRSENQRLFSEHPECWPWALVVDRLEGPLRSLAQQARSINVAAPSQDERPTVGATRFESHSRLVELYAEGIVEWVGTDLVEACGGHGKEADPERIDERCGEILTACREIMESEEELVARPVHPSLLRLQSQAKGLSLDFFGPLIWMVDSLREAIRSGGTPILHVELGSRRLNPRPVAGNESPPAAFVSAPTNGSGLTTSRDEILVAVIGISMIFGIMWFVQTVLIPSLGILIVLLMVFGKLILCVLFLLFLFSIGN